jgi:hypothetical protein
MAIYRTSMRCPPDCYGSVQYIACDPPFVFGKDDVVTIVVEAFDFFTNDPCEFDSGDVIAIQFIEGSGSSRASVYLEHPWSYGNSSLVPSMFGGSSFRHDISRYDLYRPASDYCAGLRPAWNAVTNLSLAWEDLEAPLVTGILLAGENQDVNIFQPTNRITIITPDGGVSKFWTGFRGCRELD